MYLNMHLEKKQLKKICITESPPKFTFRFTSLQIILPYNYDWLLFFNKQ